MDSSRLSKTRTIPNTHDVKSLIQFLMSDRKAFVQYLLAAWMMLPEELIIPLLVAAITGAVSRGRADELLFLAAVWLASEIPFRIIYWISRTLRLRFMRDKLAELRAMAFQRIITMPHSTFQQQSRDVYVSNLTNDVNMLESTMFLSFLNLIYTFGVVVVVSAILFAVNPPIALLVSTFTLLFSLLNQYYFVPRNSSMNLDVSNASEQFVLRASNTIQGCEIIKLNRMETRFLHNLETEIGDLERNKYLRNRFSNRVSVFFRLSTLGMNMLVFVLLFGFGVTPETVPKATLTLLLANQIQWPLRSFFERLTELRGCSGIFHKIVTPDHAATERKSGKQASFSFLSDLSLQSLSFAYGDKLILNDIDVTIKPGEKIRIEGASGSGKTTLLKILDRSETGYSGSYTIDGIDVREIDTTDFYDHVAIIDQHVYLFEDTLRNNITLYRHHDDEEITRAVAAAGLSEFVASLPDGLDHRLQEDGRNLSGGQRQRIAIARAVIKRSDILLVDEATASLDDEIGRQIEETLLGIDATVIHISHRNYDTLSLRYDAIVTLCSGQIQVTRRGL